MKYIVQVIVVLGIFLIVGCGGGSGGEPSDSPAHFTDIKVLDLSGKDMVKITKNNASELMEDSQLYLPDFDSLPFDELLSKGYNEIDNCPQGGKIHIISNPSPKTVSVDYDNCGIGTMKISGKIYFDFDTYDNDKTIGIFTISNLKIEGEGQGLQFNGQGMFSHEDSESGHNKYYIEAKNLKTGEVFKANYYIDIEKGKVTIRGVFLRPDGQYYTMQSKHVDFNSVPIVGGEVEYKDTLVFGSTDIGKIVLEGDKSELTYQVVGGDDIYRLRENLDEIKPMYSNDAKHWKQNLSEFLANENIAQLYLSADKEAHQKSFSYSPYHNGDMGDTRMPDWEKAGTTSDGIYVHVADEDSYGEYIVEIKLVKKPGQSALKTDEEHTYLLDNTYEYAGEFQRESDWALTQHVNFDVNGLYEFKIVLHDGSNKIERTFIVEYYKNELSENEHIVNYDVKKRVYVSSSEETLVLTPTKLLSIDKNGNERSMNLNNALDMAPSNDSTVYVLDGEEVLKINLDTMRIEKRYYAEEESYRYTLKSIAVSGEHVYVSDRIRTFSLDHNSGFLIPIGKGWLDSKMFINEELNRLYYAYCHDGCDDVASFQLPNAYNDGNSLQFNKALGDEIVFWKNIWKFDDAHLITSSAELIKMDSENVTDLTSDGYLAEFALNHVSNDLIYFSRNDNTNDYLIIKKEMNNEFYREDGEDGGFLDGGYPIERLKVYSSAMELKFETMLRNQYIDSDGKKYKIFPVDAFFVGSTKVSVLYSAKEVTREYGSEFVSDEVSFYLEDTKTIE